MELAHDVVEHVFYKLGAPIRPIALAEHPPSKKIQIPPSPFSSRAFYGFNDTKQLQIMKRVPNVNVHGYL